MRLSSSLSRPLALAMLAFAVAGVSGCKWFKKGAKGDYALAPEARPLEVPPDLNLPSTAGAMQLPATASAQSASQAPAAGGSVVQSASGFNVADNREQAFAKVGQALEAIDGVTIASRAQLLGTYDVAFEGSNFLVRVVGVEAGSYISAVDPRGLPAAGEAPTRLMAELRARLSN